MNKIITIDTCAVIHFMYIDRFYLFKALGYSVVTTIHVHLEFERGHSKSFAYYSRLVSSGEISRFSLTIEDLVEMSAVPKSRRASDAELSCFVVAKRIGSKTMTDDKKAIKYIQQHIQMNPGSIIQLVDLLIEAYLENHLGDHELRTIQKELADNQFSIQTDLANEAAKRRWMLKGCDPST